MQGTLLTSVFGQPYHRCLSPLPRTTHELSTSSASCRSLRRESSKHRRYIHSIDILLQCHLTHWLSVSKKEKNRMNLCLFAWLFKMLFCLAYFRSRVHCCKVFCVLVSLCVYMYSFISNCCYYKCNVSVLLLNVWWGWLCLCVCPTWMLEAIRDSRGAQKQMEANCSNCNGWP